MTRAFLFLALLFAGALAWGALQERAPGVHRLRFEIEVDAERARAVGWTAPDDDALLRLASRILEERFLAMERPLQVEVQPGTKRFRASLPSLDERDSALVQGVVRSLGVCEFLFVADGEEERERPKLQAWRAAHPEASLEELNLLSPAEGGPANGLAWFATQFGGENGQPVLGAPALVRLPTKLMDHIGATDFARSYATGDSYGYPALGFELIPTRAGDFARLTEANLGERMAIVLDGRIRSAPTLNSKLIGGGIIEGRFSSEEASNLATSLAKSAGPLRIVEAR